MLIVETKPDGSQARICTCGNGADFTYHCAVARVKAGKSTDVMMLTEAQPARVLRQYPRG